MKNYWDLNIAKIIDYDQLTANWVKQLNSLSYPQNILQGLKFDIPKVNVPNWGLNFENVTNSLLSNTFLETFESYRLRIADLGNVLLVKDIMPNISTVIANAMNVKFGQLTAIEKNISSILSIYPDFELPSKRIVDSIASISAAVELYKPPTNFLNQILAIPYSYQTFVERQYKYIEKNEEIYDRAIEVVDYAGDMLISHQVSSEASLEFLDTEDEDNYEQWELIDTQEIESRSNIFSTLNQHISYVYRRDLTPDVSKAIANSLPAIVNRLGCSIIKLIYDINKYLQMIEGRPVFTPTNSSLMGAAILPSFVVRNEIEFAEIVDYLYFMIYEGSGSAKRLIELKLIDEELQPLWRLKHLRLNFRHDLEHGSDIEKKLMKGGNAYQRLIGKPFPLCAKDWKLAQVSLYKQMLDMLLLIVNKLN